MTKFLDEDAKNWITCALDPYHDYVVGLEGMPDEVSMKSYVRVHNQTLVVGANADDDSISVTFNGSHGTPFQYGTLLTAGLADTGNPTVTNGPFLVLRSATGVSPCLQTYAAGTATNLGNFATTLDTTIPSRLIGIGIEIHDTTQPLYQKGSIVAARVQGDESSRQVVLTDTAGLFVAEQAPALHALPPTVAKMMSLPGALTTVSKEGAYVVPRLNNPAKPAAFFDGGDAVAHSLIFSEVALAADSRVNYLAVSGVDSVESQKSIFSAVPSGFEAVRIFLTGLSAESTFRITFRTIVEYFPDVSNPSQAGIATNSPSYCPEAFVQYHRAAISLPVMVPIRMNAKGDWWKMVVKALGVAGAAGLAFAGYPQASKIAYIATDAVGRVLQRPKTPAPQRPKAGKRGAARAPKMKRE